MWREFFSVYYITRFWELVGSASFRVNVSIVSKVSVVSVVVWSFSQVGCLAPGYFMYTARNVTIVTSNIANDGMSQTLEAARRADAGLLETFVTFVTGHERGPFGEAQDGAIAYTASKQAGFIKSVPENREKCKGGHLMSECDTLTPVIFLREEPGREQVQEARSVPCTYPVSDEDVALPPTIS